MIGTSLALALAPLGMRIAVVEAIARSSVAQPSFDERSTALSRSSQRFFEAVGLWPEVVAASTPIRSIHVSEQGRFGFSHIDAAEQGVEALGYVVINRVLGEVLQNALRSQVGVDFLCPARIVGTVTGADAVRTTVQVGGDEMAVSGRLLVAADGAKSAVREMIGIGSVVSDYAQSAVIGNLKSELAHDNRAFERFTESGALAMLPINEGRTAFVWILGSADAKRVMSANDAEFLAELQETFGHRLGTFSRIGKRTSYPLALSRANSLAASRAVVAGNAAHGLHPVAAQGFNLGLRDVAALSECIADAHSAGDDVGAVGVLERYAEWRTEDQHKLVRFTDGLVQLFGDRRLPARMLRTAGMLGFDLVPGVRRMFARHTMGLAGRLPRLSRGVPLQ